MAWLDNLPPVLADDWVRMRLRIEALLDDLDKIANGLTPLSVPAAEPRRVLDWADTENASLESFRTSAEYEIGLFDRFAMYADVTALRYKINSARRRTAQVISGELVGIDVGAEGLDSEPRPIEQGGTLIVKALAVFVLIFGTFAVIRG